MQAHSARHSESYMLPIQVASTPQSDQLLLDLRSRSFQEIQLFRLIFANDNVFLGKIQLPVLQLGGESKIAFSPLGNLL